MKHRFTWIELLVVVVIIVVSLAILIPVLNSHREAQRRAVCRNNSQRIGLGFANYASTFNGTFPPSAQITKAPDSSNGTVGGFSFLVKLQSFMEHDYLPRSMPMSLPPRDVDLEDISDPTKDIVAFRKTVQFQMLDSLMKTQPREFLCPSGPRRSTQPPTAGITNYKAMGATSRGSLVMVVDPQATPPYGTSSLHPDGAIFPGNGIPASDVTKGLSCTIFTIETVDGAASRWMVGKEATLVGMPQSSFTPQFPAKYRTFLSYDFSPGGADAGKYEDPGFGKTPPTYGPSSMHPGVVICGMGDGSVRAISKQTDVPNLFSLIIKNDSGFDPGLP